MYCSREGSIVCQLPSHRFQSESVHDLRPKTNIGKLEYEKLRQEELSLTETIDQVLSIADWLGEKTFWMVQSADFMRSINQKISRNIVYTIMRALKTGLSKKHSGVSFHGITKNGKQANGLHLNLDTSHQTLNTDRKTLYSL